MAKMHTEQYFPFMHMFGSFFVENFWWETERRCYLDGSGSSRWSGSFGSLENEFYCWKLLEIYFCTYLHPFKFTCLFINSLTKNNKNLHPFIHRQQLLILIFKINPPKSSNSLCNRQSIAQNMTMTIFCSPHDTIEDAVYAAFAIDFSICCMLRKSFMKIS